MENILQLFVLLPLVGYLITLLIPRKNERALSIVSIFTVGLHMVGFLAFALYWLLTGQATLNFNFLELYQTEEFSFFLDFYFDQVSCAYMAVASILTFLVTIFSRYYLHRDPGFKRLFNNILFFYFGLNLIIFAGNFETFFVGWEILGITSFLLIAFYRDRYLPVKNGLKVVSLYRLGDLCMLMAIWLCHHLLHENITFIKMNNPLYLDSTLGHDYMGSLVVCFLFLLAAAIKSAQFPFSSWLPRAMEGPTTTSAIFYGSLSVHLGVFLLLRTAPIWEHFIWIKIAIGLLGLVTAVVATGIANVQPTVKTQIAYSSIVQIGLMFIEISFGWHLFALLHFAGNAFLRTYQLLVSPSVLSYLIHDQFYNFEPKPKKVYSPAMKRLRYTFYVLGIKEFNLDFFQLRYMWTPFKWIGKHLDFLNNRIFIYILGLFYVLGIVLFIYEGQAHWELFKVLKYSYAVIGVVLILKAFAERGDAKRAWTMIAASQMFIAITIAFNEDVALSQIIIFLSGVVVSAIVGYVCLVKITTIENNISLNNFHGHMYEHPKFGLAFLLASLGLAGFPFTPTFLGIDLLFSHIHTHQFLLIALTATSFVFLELALLRLYARVFLGPHVKSYHEIAYKSS